MLRIRALAIAILATTTCSCASPGQKPVPTPPPETQESVLRKAESLVREKKYESAFKVLAEFDPDDHSPDVALKKVDILTHYFVRSIEHILFALKDLEPGEDLGALRSRGSSTLTIIAYKVQDVLGALMKRYPADYRLVKALGLFNYERSERFPDKNLDSTLYIGPLEEARGHGESDCLSLSYLGSAYLARKDGAKAFKCFEDCIKINPDNPGAHFKLAIIHNAAHRFNEALLEAKATYEELSKAQYGNGEAVRQARAEAARMTGVLQADLGDEKAARESFRAALAAYSEDALSRQYLFDTELTLGLRKEAVATATSFFAQSPKAQETYDRLIGIFKRHEALDDLQKLFDVAIGGYKDDWEVLGELHFHKGEVDVLKGEIDEARKQFEQARTCFLHVFKEGHNVYKVIDDLVAKLSGKPQ